MQPLGSGAKNEFDRCNNGCTQPREVDKENLKIKINEILHQSRLASIVDGNVQRQPGSLKKVQHVETPAGLRRWKKGLKPVQEFRNWCCCH